MKRAEDAPKGAEKAKGLTEEVTDYAGTVRVIIDSYIKELECDLRAMRDGKSGAASVGADSAKKLTNALEQLNKERVRVETILNGFAAADRAPAIDCDQARREIRRRMDCLRTAGGPREVPV